MPPCPVYSSHLIQNFYPKNFLQANLLLNLLTASTYFLSYNGSTQKFSNTRGKKITTAHFLKNCMSKLQLTKLIFFLRYSMVEYLPRFSSYYYKINKSKQLPSLVLHIYTSYLFVVRGVLLLLLLFFKVEFHCVALAVREHTVHTKLAWNSHRPTHLCLRSAAIKVVCYFTIWLTLSIWKSTSYPYCH